VAGESFSGNPTFVPELAAVKFELAGSIVRFIIALALRTAGVHVSDPDAHATESNRGNFEAASAESAFLHTITM
jgi:hypothetical protein